MRDYCTRNLFITKRCTNVNTKCDQRNQKKKNTRMVKKKVGVHLNVVHNNNEIFTYF